MKLFQLIVCCLLIAPGTARAFTIGFLEPPETAGFPREILEFEGDTISRYNPDGYPILRIWFENGHGKVHSRIFIDVAGKGALPSARFVQREWPNELPDIHYTIIGITPPRQPQVPDPTVIPLPGAVWLFGSGLAGLLLLRKRRARPEPSNPLGEPRP